MMTDGMPEDLRQGIETAFSHYQNSPMGMVSLVQAALKRADARLNEIRIFIERMNSDNPGLDRMAGPDDAAATLRMIAAMLQVDGTEVTAAYQVAISALRHGRADRLPD